MPCTVSAGSGRLVGVEFVRHRTSFAAVAASGASLDRLVVLSVYVCGDG